MPVKKSTKLVKKPKAAKKRNIKLKGTPQVIRYVVKKPKCPPPCFCCKTVAWCSNIFDKLRLW